MQRSAIFVLCIPFALSCAHTSEPLLSHEQEALHYSAHYTEVARDAERRLQEQRLEAEHYRTRTQVPATTWEAWLAQPQAPLSQSPMFAATSKRCTLDAASHAYAERPYGACMQTYMSDQLLPALQARYPLADGTAMMASFVPPAPTPEAWAAALDGFEWRTLTAHNDEVARTTQRMLDTAQREYDRTLAMARGDRDERMAQVENQPESEVTPLSPLLPSIPATWWTLPLAYAAQSTGTLFSTTFYMRNDPFYGTSAAGTLLQFKLTPPKMSSLAGFSRCHHDYECSLGNLCVGAALGEDPAGLGARAGQCMPSSSNSGATLAIDDMP